MSQGDAITAVTNALSTLLNSLDNQARKSAEAWLLEFQHTREAWATSNAILLAPDSEAPLGYKLFAAQTFRSKVTYDLSQLAPPERASLRDMLLVAMHSFAAGHKAILTQLCLATATLALQMSEWHDVVPSMISAFGGDATSANALLEFLAVLPEVVGEAHVPLSQDEAAQRAAELLSDNSDRVLALLGAYINAPGATEEMQKRTFECARNWISYGEISPTSFAETPLLNFAFDALSNDALFDTAVDVLCELIHETQEITENMSVIQMVVPRVIQLRPLLAKSQDDHEALRGYCRIFVTAGDSYRQLIVQHPDAFFPIVETVAECVSFDDLDVVPITFEFWYRLATALGKMPQIPRPFVNVYEGLVHNIIRHLRYPDEDTTMNADEKDRFRDFRHDMGDTLKDCCVILGANRCLELAFVHITEAMSKGPSVVWQAIEAPLFSMRSMGAEVDVNEEGIIPQVLDLIPRLPSHPRVTYAAILFVARYTEWINLRPQYIPYVMNFISQGFSMGQPDIIAAAGQAMNYLCKDCKTHLVAYLPQLHAFLQAQGTLLPQDDALQLYEGVAWVLSSMPVAQAASGLLEFCQPLIAVVHSAAQREQAMSRDELKPVADALENLDKLIRVMIGFGESFPPECLKTPEQVWPIFDTFLARYGTTYFVSERMSSVLRHCVQVLPTEAVLPVVSSVAVRLCDAFEKTGFSGYLWISGKLIDKYWVPGGLPIQAVLSTMVARQDQKVIQMFKQDAPETIQDVMEDYLHVVLRVIEQMPDSLYLSPSFPQVFDIILAAITLSNPDLNRVALDLVMTMLDNQGLLNAALEPNIRPPPHVEAIRLVFETYAFQLLGILLTGMMDHFVEDCVDTVVQIFRRMAKLWQGQLLVWLEPVVGQIPDSLAPADARAAFYTAMTNALGPQSIEKVKDAVLNLYRASRRLQYRRRQAMLRG